MGKDETLLAEVAARRLTVRTGGLLKLLDKVSQFVNEGRLLRENQQQGKQQHRYQAPLARPGRTTRGIVNTRVFAGWDHFGGLHGGQFTTSTGR